MFQALFRRKSESLDPHALYGTVVARARSVPFFQHYGVPDTFDGRFELMVMHLYLLISRFNSDEAVSKQVSQHLFDLFLDDMSAGLREAGVGDTVVPKRLKKMSRVFYGRAAAWDEAFSEPDQEQALAENIGRNLFDLNVANDYSHQLARHMIAERSQLAELTLAEINASGGPFKVELLDGSYEDKGTSS